MTLPSLKLRVLLGSFVAVGAIAGAALIALAQIGSTGTVLGCVGPSGVIRGVAEATGSCRSGDLALSWYTKAGADASFLHKSDQAVDADKLDGLDSASFAFATDVTNTVASLQSQLTDAHNSIIQLQTDLEGVSGSGGLQSFEDLIGLPCTVPDRVGPSGQPALEFTGVTTPDLWI